MMEVGMLIGSSGIVHRHVPGDRTSGSLPDSRELWEVIWGNRADPSLGFAHVHPGSGQPYPSHEDVTTFSAIEGALGRRLVWWIVSSDQTSAVRWVGPGKLHYSCVPEQDPDFAPELRELSEVPK